MTVETGECNGVREDSGAEFEGKSVPELVAQEDEKRSGECNGITCGEAEDVNEVAKDDVDGTYVFVNGESDELSERDLDVDDKADLAGDQRAEPSVELHDLSERDLGDESKVKTGIPDIEGSAAEISVMTPAADAELEGRTPEYKDSSVQDDKKGDLVSSVEGLNVEKDENGELISENGHSREETGASKLDLDVGTTSTQDDTSIGDMVPGHSVPEPPSGIDNEVSCKDQGCGESSGVTVCNHDGSKGEILVNGRVEDQGDSKSLALTPLEIEDNVSKPAVTGTVGSASLSLVNGKEMMSVIAEERILTEEQSVIVVSESHESESLPLGDEERLASNGTEDNPAAEYDKIMVTERSGPGLLLLGDEETLASNCTEDNPAAGQAKIMVTERGQSESLPLLNKEEVVMLNSAEEIPAVEQFAQSRVEPESEAQSTMEPGDESYENSEVVPVPLPSLDEVKIEADKSSGVHDSSNTMPSCPDKQPEAEGEATEVLVESQESSSICPVGDEETVKEAMSFGDNAKTELELVKESAESREDVSACCANDTDSRPSKEEATIEAKVYHSSPVNGIESEPEATIDSLESQNCVSSSPEAETRLEESEETASAIPGNDAAPVTEEETGENASAIPDNDAAPISEEASGENAFTIPGNDAAPISEVASGENAFIIPGNDTTPVTENSHVVLKTDKDTPSYNVDDVKLESEIGNGLVEHGEGMTDSKREIPSANKDDPNKLASEENNAIERSKNEVLVAPVDDPGNLSLPGQKVDTDVKHQPFFMVRVPRFSDDKLKMQIQRAQQEVDEKTGSRDSIRVAMQKQKATCAEYWRKVEDARKEERAARDAVSSKRQEIDSIQSFLSKLKNATSISDIDNRILKLQHRINHETNTLKEEKSLIREMNQLKQSREQLSSGLASEEELREAFEKQEEMETHLKHLKEELDTLRKDAVRAEGNTKDAKARYDSQCECLRDLQTQFKAADDLRQEAYTNLRNLKKESYMKNEHFYSYKDDTKVATNYAFSGDREALRSHCTKQIEKMMELWNKNAEFRHQYVKANMPSTVRRFRTLDGRSLGPDEEPAVIHNPTERKENIIIPSISKINSLAPALAIDALATERQQEKADAPLSSAKINLTDGPPLPQKVQPQKPKKVTKPAMTEVVSNRESVKEEAEQETKRTIEEEERVRKAEELARKEEELRKQKEAAEMKEQLRLEQIAKAKEAEERKKRKAEKAQAKAEIRAQKEAELREKKRGKKERKKERKSTTSTESIAEAEAPSSLVEFPPERVQEQPEKTASVPSKRPASRPRAVAPKEYNKVKPLPPPLRNRGKRKMQTWMWVLLTALLVLALFMAGNYVSFSKFGLRNFSF